MIRQTSDATVESLIPGVRPTYKWRVLAVVSIGVLMTTISSSSVNVALPAIGASFEASLASVAWVTVAYLTATAGLLLAFGRLSDMYGRKAMYLAGFGVFTLASALCGLAWDLGSLIGFRLLQAAGGAMAVANAPAILVDTFPGTERGRALGLMAAVVSVGLTTGPALGGLLTGMFSWRAVFYVNLPIGLIGLLLAARVLGQDRRETHEQRFDLPGSGLFLLALASLNLAMMQGEAWGWTSIPVMGLWAIFAIASLSFVWVEARSSHPMLELTLFRNRLLSAASVTAVLAYCALYINSLLLPFHLLGFLGLPSQRAGLILSAVPLATMVVAPLSGWLSDRIGSIALSSGGLSVVGLSLWSLSRLGPETLEMGILARLVVLGLGLGLFQSPNTSAILGSVPSSRRGIASGLVSTVRNLGMALGMAVAGGIITLKEAGYLARGYSSDASYLAAFRDVYLLSVFICALAVATSLVRGAQNPQRPMASVVG